MSIRRALMALAMSACVLFGQATGRLSGTILDASGSPIPGAEVAAKIPGSGAIAANTTTSPQGQFAFTGLLPVNYDLVIEAKGFNQVILRSIKVDSQRENSLPPTKLEIAAVNQVVEVAETLQGVQTTNAEVSTVITNEAFRNLPQLNRNPLALLQTQAGVTASGRTSTSINGLRPSFVNITVDGINIQDNFIRANTVDFQPNNLLSDQVSEVTLATSNTNASVGAGAAQINFVTPSGTNDLHGAVYWFNRNNALAANSWFNNRDGVKLPFLNQNQTGFNLGGPILKNKLFYYGNLELRRLRQQTRYTRSILTSDARQGIYTYRNTGGAVNKVNILQLTGQKIDPYIQSLIDKLPAASAINNFDCGDSLETLVRNTGCYALNRGNNLNRDNVTVKADYIISAKHTLTGSYLWNQEDLQRPDVDGSDGYGVTPLGSQVNKNKFVSIGWRSAFTPTTTNEFRFGFNISNPKFVVNRDKKPDFIVTGLIFNNPEVTFLDQGRTVDTWNFNDNFSRYKGKHNLQAGVQVMLQRISPYNDAGTVPSYGLGISANQRGLVLADLPGISAADLGIANNMLATLAGLVSTYTQTFQVKDRTSGFVPGQTNVRNFTFDTYSWYAADTWKISRRLTMNYGVRWEYYTVLDEKNSLFLLPSLTNGNYITSLMGGNNTLDFAGKSAGRPYYNADRNNFAPNLGLAYDLFGDGKTSLRAGYAINYVNDAHVTAIRNNISTNSGLAASTSRTGISNTPISNKPAIPTPAYKVPRTFADNYALDPTSAFGLPDPNLRTPYVQQWNFSIQREFKGGVFEARYLGNKVTKAFRAFDYNQVVINENGFLADFQRARNNGFLSVAAGGTFNPNYSGPGSQPLTVFPRLASGGLLTNATVLNLIQTGQAGELGSVYQTNGLNGAINFFNQPLGLGMNTIANYSNANYHALQLDYQRRFSRGLSAQFNYTLSKVMSDAAVSSSAQTNFEPFLDMKNPKIERSRTPYDNTHSMKGNYVYELPFGKGKKWEFNALGNKILGGWKLSGLMTWQSGSPLSIQSLRGTLNRAGRSSGENGNTATAVGLDKAGLDEVVAFRMTGRGPFFIAASAINTDGRGVAADGRAPFTGQVFFNPDAGTIGALQRRMFSGPWWFNMDMGAIKSTKIGERFDVEFRMESTNAFNNPAFYVGDYDINSVNFGRITNATSITSPRRVQFGLYVRF